MQRDTLFLLILSLTLVSIGITGMILDFLSFRAYKAAADSLRAKSHGRVNTPEDVINLIIAEANKMGITPNRVVVGKNSACVDFKGPHGTIQKGKE